MLDDFQNITFDTIDLAHTLSALGVAFVCGLAIAILYQWSYKGSSYSPTFVRSMLFMSMITAVVMLAIGNNLARAFGLVGAMSIIRFRTALKDPLDIVFVFFALAIGLAAGVGMFKVAFAGTIVIGLVILLTSKTSFGVRNRRALLLQFNYDAPQENGSATYIPVLKKYCKRHDLVNARTTSSGDVLNLTFYVNLRKEGDVETLTRELGQATHVRDVSLFFDEKEE
jgi:hypothetical protein